MSLNNCRVATPPLSRRLRDERRGTLRTREVRRNGTGAPARQGHQPVRGAARQPDMDDGPEVVTLALPGVVPPGPAPRRPTPLLPRRHDLRRVRHAVDHQTNTVPPRLPRAADSLTRSSRPVEVASTQLALPLARSAPTCGSSAASARALTPGLARTFERCVLTVCAPDEELRSRSPCRQSLRQTDEQSSSPFVRLHDDAPLAAIRGEPQDTFAQAERFGDELS